MGADLYIEPGYTKHRDKYEWLFEEIVEIRNKHTNTDKEKVAQEAVEWIYDKLNPDEFYFRDSYNDSSLLWTLGLSWWRDVSEKCDDNIEEENAPNMSMTLCKWLLDEVSTRPFIKLPKPADGETEQDVLDYFTKKRAHLIAFLKRGIENGGIYASL